MHRYLATAAATGLVAALLLTPTTVAADEDAESEDGTRSELPVLGEAEGNQESAIDTTLSLNALERAPSGETTLVWTVTNHEDGSRLSVTDFRVSQYWEYYYVDSTQGTTLLDESTQTRYYSLTDFDRACLCAGGFTPPQFLRFVDPGQTASYWNTYLLPEDLTTVTVEVPGYDPFEGIEVTDIS